MKKRSRCLGAWLAVGLALLSRASGQSLFTLEDDTRNIFSQQPSTVYPPPPPGLDVDPRIPTANQWKSGTTIGGWLTTRITDGAGTVLAGSPDTVAGPTTLTLPSFTPADGSGVKLQSVQMGRPLAGRVPTVLFGEVIARPSVDQSGTPVDESEYLPEPDNTSGGKFYYSPHARSVFATQSGMVDVVWRFRDPAHVPATVTLTYVVSASPARPTKRMYWTEKGFNGPIVQVPQGPVSTLNVIYSPQFPPQVGAEYDSPYDVPADPNLQLPPEKRTLWFSSTDRALHCYNTEGRVFIEILGALKSDNVTRQHLGTEIVEAVREVAPLVVNNFVGDKLLPHNGDEKMKARIVNGVATVPPFLDIHPVPSRNSIEYYSIRATNQSTTDPDQATGEVLVHWLEDGNFGLVWPKFYETYIVKWPDSNDAYSTYARQDAGEGDSLNTGVLIHGDNTPALMYQDDPAGQQAFIHNGLTFYSNVTAEDPEARALIRYTNGEKVWYERVRSQLDTTFAGFTGTPIPTDVGTRIEPPAGYESAIGYIRQPSGTAFDPSAYKDPFVDGVANAKSGAIIGVNARPGHNILEIWWYKPSAPPAGSGLQPTYWPATVQKYELKWPAAPAEIVMASNRGTGELTSLQASGSVYYQNDAAKPGFNPNDEHAVMIAGRAWALRDDLGTEQTSQPYVLVRYREADSRPAMTVFKVLRDKESEGLLFNYDAIAGKILQAPMPLPVLPLPYLKDGSVANVPAFELHDGAPNPKAPVGYDKFTFKDRKGSTWVYRGPHTEAEEPSFAMQYYYVSMEGFFLPGVAEQPEPGTIMPYLRTIAPEGGYDGNMSGASDQSLAIKFRAVWPANAPQLRLGETLTLPKFGLPAVRTQTSMQVLYDQALALEDETHSVVLFDPTRAKTYALSADGLSKIPGSVATSDYRGKTYFPNLPPHLSQRVYVDANLGEQGSLVLIGEFKDEAFGEDYLLLNALSEEDRETLIALCDEDDDDFDAWSDAIEGLETIVQTFIEDPTKRGTYKAKEPVKENVVDTVARDAAWNWLMEFEFLADGMYFTDVTDRFKTKNAQELTPLWGWMKDNKDKLANLRRDYKYFAVGGLWQNRAFYGYARGYANWLNLEKYWSAATSEANLARARTDMNAWYDARPNYSSYRVQDIIALEVRAAQLKRESELLKADLTTKVYTELQPKHVTSGQDELTEITSPDTAVDSYALTAAGGGEGWVVLVSGNGKAFTPEGEPVSVHIIRVTAPLGRGELKVIAPSNPLDEKLTLQQSLDFAARTEDYEFEWRYAPPVDGLPPVLYSYDRALIMGDGGPWTYTNGAGDVSTLNLPASLDGHAGASPVKLTRQFNLSSVPLRLFLSLDLGANDGVTAAINGTTVASWNVPGTANTAVVAKPSPDFSPLSRLLEIPTNSLEVGDNTLELTVVTTADAGAVSFVNARLEGMQATEHLSSWISLPAAPKEEAGDMPASIKGKNRHVIQGPGIFTLTDNYFVCRYRATDTDHAAFDANGGWSKWTEPQLAEGWIKRALAGINPFQQRVTDLYNNAVNTDVSLVTQAGRRWEGDISLNLANINQFGLIEIYETILRRGKALSIEGTPPLSYGPANDALLLAAGYLNDLYMIMGNEAYADAANPTIAYNTDSGQFGDVASSLFAFKGQVGSVLEEELGLLRGRDDFLPPGTRTAPVYNRLIWNYTRGIDSGEAVYALNYNIKDLNSDGTVSAADAAIAYPQGHGDAYGHYLTAMTNYYSLLRNSHFDWMPRSEAVLLLGKPVSVDYLDERKFATAAAALARTTAQTLDLTYRQAYNPAAATEATWTHLQDGRENAQTGRARNWGVDDWATRGGQGSFLHWVTANSTLPDVDPNPNHEGIQKIDRTTVPELAEIVVQSKAIQQSLDAADARLNPLGISGGALPFDISPTQVDAGKTHFEQIYERAVDSLRNAVSAFDNAKTSTRLIRSQDESLAKARDVINAQERAFTAQLIDIYGTPYAEDVGPGKTYAQGYEGPDYYHYMYVDIPELFKNQPDETEDDRTFTVQNGTDWNMANINDARWRSEDQVPVGSEWKLNPLPDDGLGEPLVYTVDSTGAFKKPDDFTRRARPGRIQDSIAELLMARLHLHNALEDYAEFGLQARRLIRNYQAVVRAHDDDRSRQVRDSVIAGVSEVIDFVLEKVDGGLEISQETFEDTLEASEEALPKVLGMASDPTFAARAAFETTKAAGNATITATKTGIEWVRKALELVGTNLERASEIEGGDIAWKAEHAQLITDLKAGWEDLEDGTRVIDQALQAYDNAKRKLRAATYDAQRIVSEREIVRQKAAALIQGYRTKDFGFRAFRNEALESYKSLFDLSARYTFLAARAYDYETGLANAAGSSRANDFFQKIVQARALGVVANGQPQNAGSQGGDPGLSGALARMNSDWSVVKSRLGFNNPDRYRTLFSLRQENERIVPGPAGDSLWADKLAAARMNNILEDDDVRRYCMQVNNNGALSVPGYVIPFSTTIANGFNFFGQPLAGGDSSFTSTSFATKIRSNGIAFKGYVGMASPTSIGGAVTSGGGGSPADPDTGFLDPNALSATPYVYLIAAGEDSMRSPALGDTSVVRTWQVEDQAIALPFDIGGADIGNNIFTPGQSLSEAFTIRKHQAFRAVPDGTVFNSSTGFTNARLIGRSAWNSRWKIVIPANTLLADPVKGMQIFEATVKDIKLYLETYSYSGN